MDFIKLYSEEKEKAYFKELIKLYQDAKLKDVIYPKLNEVFKAFNYAHEFGVKVIIIGQDPYPGPRQAHGLAFSVCQGTPIPRTLANIFKEMENDLGVIRGSNGDLTGLAEQGVFLLNTILTVEANKPLSHQNIGWEKFTSRVVEILSQDDRPKVFILWGKKAQLLKSKIQNPKHLIITSPHPSPLSAWNGFFGSRPFSRTNAFLKEHNILEIDWSK